MSEVIEPDRILITSDEIEHERPKGVQIALSVCQCYASETLVFVTEPTRQVASILDMAEEDLKHKAIAAMLSGNDQIVGCFKSQDIGETRHGQLEAITPFIARACHSFEIIYE
tara:strand:+ start:36662 stop:37000 length:339 start_codon:yes stop_codon:yes gene_type:complete